MHIYYSTKINVFLIVRSGGGLFQTIHLGKAVMKHKTVLLGKLVITCQK